MKNHNQVLGRWGEDVAVGYLKNNAYKILARNYRTRHGEIDIVAEKEGAIIFVEVKLRSSIEFGFPEDAVTPRKQAHLLQAAEKYFIDHPDSPETWQFDIVAITRHPGSEPAIEYFENVIG
jgi:putative endonuclease